MKIGMFFQEITSITEFPGSNILLTLFLTGGKLDFKVANLLLATVKHFATTFYTTLQALGTCKTS